MSLLTNTSQPKEYWKTRCFARKQLALLQIVESWGYAFRHSQAVEWKVWEVYLFIFSVLLQFFSFCNRCQVVVKPEKS